MIPSKLLKSCIPVRMLSDGLQHSRKFLDTLPDYMSTDPTGGTWSSYGFIPVEGDDEFDVSIDGCGTMLAVQFNERMLPGKVRDEELAKRAAHYEEQEGRKLNKKEYAELRDQVEFDMLPKSHIRRSIVPVIIQGRNILIFTGSMKRSDDVMGLLITALGDAGVPFKLGGHFETMTERSIAGLLYTVARDEVLNEAGDPDTAQPVFQVGDAVVLKRDKQTIRIKDKNVGDHDVQTLLKQEYAVAQLGLEFVHGSEDDEPTASFIISDKFVISKLVVSGVSAVSRKAPIDEVLQAEQNNRYVVARELKDALAMLTDHLGGFRSTAEESDPLAKPVQQEQSSDDDNDPL